MDEPVLGIDVGSVSVATVLVNPDRCILHTDYRFHRGRIRQTLAEALEALPRRELGGIACTSSSPRLVSPCRYYDTRICYVDAIRLEHRRLGSLVVVGGERFAALRFDAEGRFLSLRASTSCAAGTGSFLDQQARRLGLEDSAELARLALGNRGSPPAIASRCSVFAKTDLCHAQQNGYSLAEICDGLCRGLARNVADTISAGEPLPVPAFLAGGVSRNPAVVRHLEQLLGIGLGVGEHSHLLGAIGACLNLLEEAGAAAGESCERQAASNQAGSEGHPGRVVRFRGAAELIIPAEEGRSYYNPPLALRLSEFPEFGGEESSVFRPEVVKTAIPVEVDRYASQPRGVRLEALLGVDVGSTSTKAVLLNPDREVLAGFYTRTAGRPLLAVQAIFEAVEAMIREQDWRLEIVGAATTGAGRSFVGRVIGADLIINEITAHARAAYELDPTIDTIIEIGGQDAKFTTMRDGLVSFSQMNTVCAAGTGSFIEEQAARLGVPLADYSRRAEGQRSPLASDRCTVFMERDINHYLNLKYSVDEILATVLHSVRENYLLKVASQGLIGRRVCFQGATAKNRALVAAFEEKLKQPIFVSRYCHLTGALGAALSLQECRRDQVHDLAGSRKGSEQGKAARLEADTAGQGPATHFRGLGLYRSEIPVRGETCELCANHCRLRIAEVQGDSVAYGFLCGRDYGVKRFVSRNSLGFDLLGEIRRLRQEAQSIEPGHKPVRGGRTAVSVGIPAALHLYDELALWRRFFAELSIPTVSTEDCTEALRLGKEITGAEFCAPVTALHGHVRWLLRGAQSGRGAERACDRVFLPVALEAPREDRRGRRVHSSRLRYHCYYTQFSPAVVASVPDAVPEGKLLTPLIDHGRLEGMPAGGSGHPGSGRLPWGPQRRTARELFRALKPVIPDLRLREVSRAYARALAAFVRIREGLQELYRRDSSGDGDIRVVLTGRPYLILPPSMNKGIPGVFASLGVRSYYQDMIPRPERIDREVESLLDAFHWHHAARILETAEACVRTEGLYPVLVTAFKCSPDSFVIEYFKRLLDSHGKPYLILQIDEHDSSVGYETRIEAGVHSFRNHYRSRSKSAVPAATPPHREGAASLKVIPELETRLDGRVLLFPHLDPLTSPLVVAHLQGGGIDARLLEETPLAIQKAMRLNTGQCIPISVITQEAVDYIRDHGLDPSRVVLWMARSEWSCGIHLYPYYIKSLLEAEGMGRAGVYIGEVSHFELSLRLAVGTYFAYLFGGLLRRIGCRIRPYELEAGMTDRVIAEGRDLLAQALRGQRSRLETLREVIRRLEAIPVVPAGGAAARTRGGGGDSEGRRPKVAIFGDLYVRDNEVMNQDLIHWIEAAGGEVVTTPYSEYVRIVAEAYFRRWRKQGRLLMLIKNKVLLAAIRLVERRFFALYASHVSPPESFHHPELEKELELFNLRLELSGESYDNVLKILHLLRMHPDISLFVQTNPAFCCPALVTESMTRRIEELTGVPVLTLTYDGTGTPKNDLIMPYLKYPRRPGAGSRPEGLSDRGLARVLAPFGGQRV